MKTSPPRLFLLGLAHLLVVACALTAHGRTESTPQPLGDFFRHSSYDEIELSPDGTKVAALSVWKEHLNLYVIDLKTKQPKMLTGMREMSVQDVRWVGSNRLIFTGLKDEGVSGGLFAMDADGGNACTLAESVDQQVSRGARIYRHTGYLAPYGDSSDEVLVTSNERRLLEPDVYRLNIHTGAKRMVAMNPGNVTDWLADRQGAVRIGYGATSGKRFLVHRAEATGEFREIKSWRFLEGDCEPLAFDRDNRLVYVRTNLGGDTLTISLLDPETGEIVKELFHDPIYDAGNVLLRRDTGELLGFSIQRERPELVWTDPEMARLQAMIDEALPETLNRISSRSSDYEWVVIDAHSDRDPGAFHLLNTRTLNMEKLVSRMDWINPARMSPMKPVEYKARDGLTIHGYLTIPIDSDGKNLPLVVNPHGGPRWRDSWGFNGEVQFLASRGYAVLQINFRGSIGYGRKFDQAGFGQWGLAMQDDITDGVRWAVEQGIADPGRVAIYGASYGGYATMAGLAFTPELYRCGINYVGVTDATLLVSTIPDGWENFRDELEAMTGNRRLDRERMLATSPLKNVDRIRAPVFLAYGVQDERVDLKHGTKLAAALRKNGVPVVWMQREDEGHGYVQFDNKVAFYTQMESFLAEHMAPR